MTREQYNKLMEISEELVNLYKELRKEKCAVDILLALCNIGSITVKEILGDYK